MAAAGILAGIALFLLPFILLRLALFALVVWGIFRLLRFSPFRKKPRYREAFIYRWQRMDENEKENIKKNWPSSPTTIRIG